jgi:serine/threonine protein kinase
MRTKNERVTELLIAWEEYQSQGSAVSPEALCRDCPNLLPALRERINALESMEAMLRQTAGSENSGTQSPHFSQDSLLADLKPGRVLRGYELIERIGRGGFSVVWKARGPSGFPVALKFVPLDGPTGKAEKRALRIMLNARHPNLLSIFGAWGKRNTIVIAMELADRTLHDRFSEARLQGLPGIPRDELLEYMSQAAQALDYLNKPNTNLGNPGGAAHRDIKPHNLLLFGGGVKVGDLGLVRCLHGRSTSHTGSMTIAYAPPEFFDGRTTRWSDQYSLAVSYCLLRGGRLPFEGSPYELMRGHLDQLPYLVVIGAQNGPT